MKFRGIIMIALAATLGLAAVFLAQNWLANSTPSPEQVKRATVVVAAAPLNFGDRLSTSNLREITWPAEVVPQGAFTSVDQLLVKGEDRVVLRSMDVNEPILPGKITMPGGRATLSTVLPKDKRAITIRVNDVLGVAGFVLPGDRVDVLLTRSREDREQPQTDILLQNVRVLGIDQETNDRKDKPTVARAVTLEVAPDDAQKLTLGSQVGSLSLALRNHGDSEAVAARTIRLSDLQSAKAEAVVAKAKGATPRPAASGTSVKIMRGTETATYALPNTAR